MELLSESKKFIVVGGGGYIGYHIGVALWKRGHAVNLFDISQPDPFWLSTTLSIKDCHAFIQGNSLRNDSSYLEFVLGSVLDLKALEDAIAGADCVIHCASYGMSGQEQMPTEWDKTEEINVTGTENVLKACLAAGVRALVYTSSCNVVFGGQEIINGDESLPYFPLHQHSDHYSRTKAIAERLVLFSDKLLGESETPKPLRTCALRLAGVFGLGEKRHLPRIVDTFGLAFFKFGYGESVQQFCTLKNVVQGHVKAAEQLLSTPEPLGGQPYFISDGVPINTFEFLRPLREAIGYSQPRMKAPMWLIWVFVYVIQMLHCLCSSIHPSLSFKPVLTPAEVFKTGVTHYFSSAKAERDFGYLPEKPNDILDVVEYYRKRMPPRLVRKDEAEDASQS